ncbi:MAG: hypothetical protein OEV21_04410 [Thermoplasmata archaeon]|nr:hypothetical protein [Thermoplasmata archaeon]
MRIPRTVIGSFPKLRDDDIEAIDAVIALQKKFGVDIFTDGEQRGDMIIYLARAIPGLSVENKMPIVSGKVSPPEDPREVHKVADYFMLRKKYPDIKFKVTLTGPTTLAISCGSKKLSKDYRSYVDFKLTEDIAYAIKEIVRPLREAKAFVQIDEPILSQGFRDLKERIRLMDLILEGCDPNLCSTHVCGWLGRQPVLQELSKLENLTVLSHAFSAGEEIKNFDLLDRALFEDNGKKLGAGVISVSPIGAEDIERPEKVSERLASMVKKMGIENIAYSHPDCGLGATRREFVEGILESFYKGTELYGSSGKDPGTPPQRKCAGKRTKPPEFSI